METRLRIKLDVKGYTQQSTGNEEGRKRLQTLTKIASAQNLQQKVHSKKHWRWLPAHKTYNRSFTQTITDGDWHRTHSNNPQLWPKLAFLATGKDLGTTQEDFPNLLYFVTFSLSKFICRSSHIHWRTQYPITACDILCIYRIIVWTWLLRPLSYMYSHRKLLTSLWNGSQ